MLFSPLRTTLAVAAFSFAVAMSAATFAAEITHELGTTEVPDAPQRIVVLEFSFVDSLSAIGVSPVGIADDNDRARIVPAYTDVIGDDWTSVGTRASPSLEVIASLQPDLIIADKRRHEAVYDALSEIAPTLVFDSLSGEYEVSLQVAQTIADAVGEGEAMQARIKEHRAKMDAFKAELGDVSDWSIQFFVDNGRGIYLHSPQSYNGSLLAWFGFQSNMVPTDGEDYAEVIAETSLEQLSVINPQIMLRAKYADPGLTDSWVGQPLYDNLDAVTSERVFDVFAHNWSRLRGVVASEVSAANLVELMSQIEE